MGSESDDFLPTRRTLLSRLKNWNDQESWREFFETYGRLLYGVARRAGLADAEAQDTVQETIITVAKQMPHFKYDPAAGSFKQWLLQIAHSRIADQWRKKMYKKDGRSLPREETLQTALVAADPDFAVCELEKIWDEEWEKHLLQTVLERVKRRANLREYQMFHLCTLKERPAAAVARLFGTTVAEVYAAKHRISELIKREMQTLEQKGV